MMRLVLPVLLACLLTCTSHAQVVIDSSRLAAEMKYWLCSADGETGDLLLHVMAEKTINSPMPATCATFSDVISAVTSAATAKSWLPPNSSATQPQRPDWSGCKDPSCRTLPDNVMLKVNTPTYIRLLEFGHEQAASCKDASAAIDAFVGNLASAGCAAGECGVMDYVSARPAAADSGCKDILVAA